MPEPSLIAHTMLIWNQGKLQTKTASSLTLLSSCASAFEAFEVHFLVRRFYNDMSTKGYV